MKFDILTIAAMFSLMGGIIMSAYFKSIEGVIGWALALMWFFIAQYAFGRKNDGN